jgi:hypothetical protein
VLFIFNLDPFFGLDQRRDHGRVEFLDVLRGLAIHVLLAVRQVPLAVLGEEVDENRELPGNPDDDGPVAAPDRGARCAA